MPGDIKTNGAPDPDWLRDQPKTWHELNRALHDIATLLRYLGEMPEARLLSYFEDTKGRIVDGGAQRTVPPCASYVDFLNRLFEIGSAFQTGQPDPYSTAPTAPAPRPPLSSIAFVYWSRDFLSAVAAPATADTIRMTHDFLVHRAWSFNPFSRRRPWSGSRVLGAVPSTNPPLPPEPDAPTRFLLASKLAGRVRRYEIATIAGVMVAILVSIYALSGRLILSNEQDMRDAWSKIDAQLEAQEEKLFKTPVLPVSAGDSDTFAMIGLCDLERDLAVGAASAREAASDAIRTDASTGDPPHAATRKAYVTPRQAHLCDERARVLLNLFVVTMHLQSWSSAVTQRLARYDLPVAPFFGIVPATLKAYSHEADGDLCVQIDPHFRHGGGWPECREILWNQINRSRNVAQSVLGSITQYILPVLYGFLGAMAAAMRLLRRKVDSSLVSYTDRARLQQGAILGVLGGAVIGLFASSVGGAGVAGGLGLSALALLAGYNVDGVFRLLDELSDRLFRPNSGTKPAP